MPTIEFVIGSLAIVRAFVVVSETGSHSRLLLLYSSVRSGFPRGAERSRYESFPSTVVQQCLFGLTKIPIRRTMTTPTKVTIDFVSLKKEIGVGPMRFAPFGERSLNEQLESLAPDEKQCFDELKSKWEREHPNDPFSDEMILRFARCSPGVKKFNTKTAWKVMQRYDRRYLTLKAGDIEEQLMSQTLFPVPGLKTKEGNHDVFYMRPSRYFPKKTPTKDVIDNLAYCMETMVEKEGACTDGIGFIANMTDWKMENFSIDYCFQFMKMLQGRVPVRVRLFLIVNPPKWFGTIWGLMKPMLASDFRKKVKMVPFDHLEEYFAEGYIEYLPDDVTSGKADTAAMVKDFVIFRKLVEA